MAPIKPSSKPKRPADPHAVKQRTSYPAKAMDSAFTTSKKDKRLMKHSLFVSKVRDSGVKKLKRRRPANKLVTNLESLEDALQDVAGGDAEKQTHTQMKNVREGRGQAKRKEKVLKEESERFGKNMAILSSSTPGQATTDAPSGRWAALRAHIQASMPEATTDTG